MIPPVVLPPIFSPSLPSIPEENEIVDWPPVDFGD